MTSWYTKIFKTHDSRKISEKDTPPAFLIHKRENLWIPFLSSDNVLISSDFLKYKIRWLTEDFSYQQKCGIFEYLSYQARDLFSICMYVTYISHRTMFWCHVTSSDIKDTWLRNIQKDNTCLFLSTTKYKSLNSFPINWPVLNFSARHSYRVSQAKVDETKQ